MISSMNEIAVSDDPGNRRTRFHCSHTVQALLDAGEECVLLQRRSAELPAGRFSAPVQVEQGDVTDLSTLLWAGTRHKITGIVHLAGSMPWPPGSEPPAEATRRALEIG